MGMGANMVASMLMGAIGRGGMPINPILGTGGLSATDHYQAQMRMMAMQDQSFQRAIFSSGAFQGPLIQTFGGAAGGNPVFQQIYDMVAPGGSSAGLMSNLYRNLTTSMPGTFQEQVKRAAGITNAINEEFRTAYGTFDYTRSGGLNRGELGDLINEAARRGMMPINQLRAGTVDVRQLRQMGQMVQAAREIAGPQATVGESLDLARKIIPNLEEVSPEKSRELLSKVKAVSNVLDIDAKAMAAYVEMMNKMYQNAGVSTRDGAGAQAAMRSLMSAKAVAETVGFAPGMGALRDVNAVAQAEASLQTKAQGGQFMTGARAYLQVIGGMTPEQRRQAAPFIDQLVKGLNSGDVASVRRAQEGIRGVVGEQTVLEAYRNPNEIRIAEEARASGVNLQRAGEGIINAQGQRMVDLFMANRQRTLSARETAGLTANQRSALLRSLGSDMNREQIQAVLQQANILNGPGQERRQAALASELYAGVTNEMLSTEGMTRQELRVAAARQDPAYIARMAEKERLAQRQEAIQTVIQSTLPLYGRGMGANLGEAIMKTMNTLAAQQGVSGKELTTDLIMKSLKGSLGDILVGGAVDEKFLRGMTAAVQGKTKAELAKELGVSEDKLDAGTVAGFGMLSQVQQWKEQGKSEDWIRNEISAKYDKYLSAGDRAEAKDFRAAVDAANKYMKGISADKIEDLTDEQRTALRTKIGESLQRREGETDAEFAARKEKMATTFTQDPEKARQEAEQGTLGGLYKLIQTFFSGIKTEGGAVPVKIKEGDKTGTTKSAPTTEGQPPP
jgi:hypothetical protein